MGESMNFIQRLVNCLVEQWGLYGSPMFNDYRADPGSMCMVSNDAETTQEG